MAPSSALETYIGREAADYRTYRESAPENARRIQRRHLTWLKRTRQLAHWLEDQGVVVPETHLQPYAAPPADRVAAGLPIKYQIRAYNVLRDLARVRAACPELLAGDTPPRTILDKSSGGCGLYECLAPHGHEVRCLDYFPEDRPTEFGNSYALIHHLLGVDVQHIDGTVRPSSLAPSSFDYVFCFQAIDAYAPADRWIEAVDELLRVARQTVVVVLNPPPGKAGFEASVAALTADIASRPVTTTRFQCPDTGLPGFRWDKRP